MQRQLQRVERSAGWMENALASALLAQLGQVLRDYRRTGVLPANDLHRSFIELVQSSQQVMDSTVGGTGHAQASEVYQQALDRYQGVLQAYGVSYGSGGSVR